MGPIFLLQCPVSSMASCPRTREEQSWFCRALEFQHALFLQPPVVTRTMGINTDPSCRRATDSDMAICSSSGPEVIMALGGSTGHSYQHGSSIARFLDTNTATDGIPDPGHSCDLWWQCVMNANIYSSCGRTMDLGMVLGSIPAQILPLGPDGKQTTHIILFLNISPTHSVLGGSVNTFTQPRLWRP